MAAKHCGWTQYYWIVHFNKSPQSTWSKNQQNSKVEISDSIVIIGNFNLPLSKVDRTITKKFRQKTNNTINQLGLTKIHRSYDTLWQLNIWFFQMNVEDSLKYTICSARCWQMFSAHQIQQHIKRITYTMTKWNASIWGFAGHTLSLPHSLP